MKRFREVSPSLKARIAGLILALVVLTSAITEFFARGRLSSAADLAAGMPVNRNLSLLAAISNLLALTLELVRFPPHGVNIGLGFHG